MGWDALNWLLAKGAFGSDCSLVKIPARERNVDVSANDDALPGLSRSADLAYDYGEFSSENANVTEHGIYLSIWQIDPSSEWRLMLDLQKKVPPEKK